MTGFIVTSAFENGAAIPVRFANRGVAGGQNVSPPLAWSGVPEGTQSFALVCVDRHPAAGNWVHWMVIDIPADVVSLAEGASGSSMPAGSRELVNTFGRLGWGGPQPPQGSGDHEYAFTLYAMPSATQDLPDDATAARFQALVSASAIGQASLSGYFRR